VLHRAGRRISRLCSGNNYALYTENSAPNNYLAEDGKTVRGIATDKIEAALKRAAIPYTINVVTWSRALNLTKQHKNACVYSTARIPERDAYFQWVAPVARSNWYIWGKRNSAKPASLEEFRGKSICDLLGNAPGRYLLAKGLSVISSESHEICVRNVLRGFVDYWSTSLAAGTAELARLGYQDQLVPLYEFEHKDLYLACNLAMPQKTIDQMRAAFQENVTQ
jgi:polar amino acid transport system substrate-binding protein